MLAGHRRDIVQPVEIRDRLHIAFIFDQFFGAAMQKSDMRIGAVDHLAIHLQDQSQHAMGGRVLRPEIDCMAIDLDGFLNRLKGVGSH